MKKPELNFQNGPTDFQILKMSLLDELQAFNGLKISTIPTPLLEHLVANLNRELSRRQAKNPICALKEWSEHHPKRKVTYSFHKWEEIGEWVCVLEVWDEHDKEYISVCTYHYAPNAKRILKRGVALDMCFQLD